MPEPIRLLALDLDGTALNDAKHLSPATRAAIADAIAAGVTVVPTSGRPFFGISREVLDLPGIEYAISNNGASINRVSDGAAIYTDCLEDEVALELIAAFLPLDICSAFFFADRAFLPASQAPNLDRLILPPVVLAYLKATRPPIEHPLERIRQAGGVQKISLNFPHLSDGSWSDWPKVKAVLDSHPNLSVVSGGADNLEITSPTAEKGRALLALAETLGIPRAQTMACGDSGNDVSMLDAAGFAVAMANSEEAVFAHADAVTASNEEDGVAKAIRKYILKT